MLEPLLGDKALCYGNEVTGVGALYRCLYKGSVPGYYMLLKVLWIL